MAPLLYNIRATAQVSSVPRFAFAPVGDWLIAPSVTGPRRRQLLLDQTSFARIVERLGQELSVVRISREPGYDNPSYYRYCVKLKARPSTIDCWHNGRGGYRAQYYLSERLGEAANSFACERLLPIIERTIAGDSARRRFWTLTRPSIVHERTRLWVHQGLWLRHAKKDDQHLFVPRWQANIHSTYPKAKKLNEVMVVLVMALLSFADSTPRA
jgi:hypothetical protein